MITLLCLKNEKKSLAVLFINKFIFVRYQKADTHTYHIPLQESEKVSAPNRKITFNLQLEDLTPWLQFSYHLLQITWKFTEYCLIQYLSKQPPYQELFQNQRIC